MSEGLGSILFLFLTICVTLAIHLTSLSLTCVTGLIMSALLYQRDIMTIPVPLPMQRLLALYSLLLFFYS